MGEVLHLEIFPRLESSKGSSQGIVKVAVRVIRTSKKKREIALTFLTEINQGSLYSL